MIKPENIEFHIPANIDHSWAETNYFCLTIQHIDGGIEPLPRATLERQAAQDHPVSHKARRQSGLGCTRQSNED